MKASFQKNNDVAGLKTLQSIAAAKTFNAWMYQTIKPYIKGRVLELGAGIGNITDFLTSDFTSVVLSDYNPAYCEYLQNRYRLTKSVHDVLNIDLQDPAFRQTYRHLQASFDSILLLNVIEHLEDDRKCADYCHFLLRPGGHFIVLAPAYALLYSKLDKEIGHYRRYTKNTLASVLEDRGFYTLTKQYFNAVGVAGWLVFNKILGRKEIAKGTMKFYDSLVPLNRWVDKVLGQKFGLSAIVVGKKAEGK